MTSDLRTLVTAARTLQQAGDIAAALDLYDQAVQLDPTNGPAQFGLGTCAQLLGQPARALRAYEASVPTFPDHPGITTRMAHLQRQLGLLDEAQATYQRARELNPDDANVVVGMAQVLTLLGDDEGALACLESREWDEAATRSIDVQRTRALLGLGRFDEAQKVADGLASEAPNDALVRRLLLSDIASARWHLTDAEHQLALACDAEPGNPALHLRHAGRLLALLLPNAAMGALRRRASLVAPAAASDIRPRATQGLLADIANEYLLAPVTLEAASRALLADDVPAAARLVRITPRSLAAATALLVTLRRTDLLRTDAPLAEVSDSAEQEISEAAPGIPRHVVQAWFGSTPPAEVNSVTATWRRRPGWRYTRVDDRSALAFLTDEVSADAAQAFRRARHPAARADLFRLAWLAARGGVWADVDDAARGSLDALVDGRSLVVWQEDRGNLANDFLAAAPGHPAIVAARDEAIVNILATYTESTWLATGPGLVTRHVAAWLASNLETLGSSTVILDRHEIRRVVVPGLPLPYKSTRAYWLHAESGA
jgi:tetratricopeptide (TPR) repeat protein